jgi:PhnB protein
MQLNPHLIFDGQCEAAFKFYQKCLGGKIVLMMRNGDSPMAGQLPRKVHKRIMHATFHVGGAVLTGGDAPPGRYQKPQGFSVLLHLSDAKQADRIFKALARKGTVEMPLQETFWALRFGMLVDRFGTPWMINCGKPSPS